MGIKMSESINCHLIEHSNTFPEFEYDNLIPLDSKVREIEKRFNKDNQVIILSGMSGSGKTTHLAQFVQTYPDCCFSYFLTDNYWTWRQSNFLLSLCVQLSCFLGQEIRFDDTFLSDTERVKTYFETLVHQSLELARSQKKKLYFIVDGLEWAFEGVSGERIIDILPIPTSPKGLFFLGSINSKTANQLIFKHEIVEPRTFSILETEIYLADLQLDKKVIENIQKISGGIPGYIAILRRLVNNGNYSLDKIISHPAEINELLEIQWRTSNVEQSELKGVVALLAYSLVPLSCLILSHLSGVDQNIIEGYLQSTGLFQFLPDENIKFFPDILKGIAKDRLSNLQDLSIEKLTKYYEDQVNQKSTNLLLPEYYRISKIIQQSDH